MGVEIFPFSISKYQRISLIKEALIFMFSCVCPDVCYGKTQPHTLCDPFLAAMAEEESTKPALPLVLEVIQVIFFYFILFYFYLSWS